MFLLPSLFITPPPQGGTIASAKSVATESLEVTHKALFGGKEGAGATFTGPAVFQGNVEVGNVTLSNLSTLTLLALIVLAPLNMDCMITKYSFSHVLL